MQEVAWKPNPGPQTAFLACPIFEVFFGGAAGGGKSDALLVDALKDMDREGANALIIRRSYPELRDLIARSRRLYKAAFPHAVYNKAERMWTFPSGSTVSFGYIKKDDDVYRYQGQEYTRILWDELTHYTEWAYLYLMSRVRSTDPRVRVGVRGSGNPGGKGHAWVKARFIDPAAPLSVIVDEESQSERVFIPSKLSDNPHLAKTGYGQRLKMLGSQDMKALAEGDWDAYTGAVFDLQYGTHIWSWAQFNDFYQLPRENREIPRTWPRFRTMDWGYAKPFAVYWYAVAPGGRAFIYREYYGVQMDKGRPKANAGLRLEPAAVADRIRDMEAGDPAIQSAWTGPDLGHHGSGDKGAAKPPIEEFEARGVYWQYWDASPGSRVRGKLALHQRLAFERSESGNMVEYPGLIILEDAAPNAVRTLQALEPDPANPELIDSDGEDHAYDSINGFCKMRPWAPGATVSKPVGAYQKWVDQGNDDNDWMT